MGLTSSTHAAVALSVAKPKVPEPKAAELGKKKYVAKSPEPKADEHTQKKDANGYPLYHLRVGVCTTCVGIQNHRKIELPCTWVIPPPKWDDPKSVFWNVSNCLALVKNEASTYTGDRPIRRVLFMIKLVVSEAIQTQFSVEVNLSFPPEMIVASILKFVTTIQKAQWDWKSAKLSAIPLFVPDSREYVPDSDTKRTIVSEFSNETVAGGKSDRETDTKLTQKDIYTELIKGYTRHRESVLVDTKQSPMLTIRACGSVDDMAERCYADGYASLLHITFAVEKERVPEELELAALFIKYHLCLSKKLRLSFSGGSLRAIQPPVSKS